MNQLPLSQIVSEFLDEINGGEAEFSRAYRMASRILRKFAYDMTSETVSARLYVNVDGTITLPEDCIRVERVNGLCNLDYTINDSFILLHGCGNSGRYFEIEYHSLERIDNDFAVHPYISEAIITELAYTWFKNVKTNKNKDIQLLRADMKKAKMEALSRMRQPTKQEMYYYTEKSKRRV